MGIACRWGFGLFCPSAMRSIAVNHPRRKQRGFQRNFSMVSGESCPPTPPNMDAIHPHRKQWGILSCFRENALFREMVSEFVPPPWAKLVVVGGDAAYGSQ